MEINVGPGQYVRKTGIIADVGLYIKKFGTTAVLIGGHTSRKLIVGTLRKSFSEHGITLKHSLWFGGESSATNIERLVELLAYESFEVLLDAGGGKEI
jgi:glycerol dehydrogenase